MRRYLLAARWPAGLTAIAAATVMAARRAPGSPSPAAAVDPPGPGEAGPSGTADEAPRDGAGPAGPAGLTDVTELTGVTEVTEVAEATNVTEVFEVTEVTEVIEVSKVTKVSEVTDPAAARADWVKDLIRLGAISCAGGALSYGVMALLGPPIVNHGLAIDEPILSWTTGNQLRTWAAIMERFNKFGDTWTAWSAAG